MVHYTVNVKTNGGKMLKLTVRYLIFLVIHNSHATHEPTGRKTAQSLENTYAVKKCHREIRTLG